LLSEFSQQVAARIGYMRNSLQLFRGALFWAFFVAGMGELAQAQEPPRAPAPSQVTPPRLPTEPRVAPQIPSVSPPEAPAFPKDAEKLSLVLLGFDVEGEFEEFVATRRELAAPLIGKRVTVAQIFEFATKLQEAYVQAGYLLVRVVVVPQELGERARVKIRVIDGFIERIDVSALPSAVRNRIAAVLEPLFQKRHLTQDELERRLLLAGDTPGLELRSTFAPGEQIGGSVLILTGLHRPVSASAYIDNAMPVTFGTLQNVALLGLNSVLGAGEQITVSATGYPGHDFATEYPTRRFLQGAVVFPVGIDGLKMLVAGTDGRTTPRVELLAQTQGIFRQNTYVLAYDAIKKRDSQLTFSGRFDATYERVDTLVLTPPVSLRLDEVRPVRASVDGAWRLREIDTSIAFGATVSRGLNALGARTLADATPELPLSRQGADAVFTKLNLGLAITKYLPSDFFVATTSYAQSSFRRPLLTSEQFDIIGPKMVSGLPVGLLPGDAAWVVRTELGHVSQFPIESGGLSITPYAFGAMGERIYYQPTVLELGSVHVTNVGIGLRLISTRWAELMPNSYAFVEGSRVKSSDPTLEQWRIFAGALIQY
jgi:hemolysin activation/secretion protein